MEELNEENKHSNNIDNISNFEESQHEFQTISKEQDKENQHIQEDSSLNKENDNNFPPEINELNDDDINININDNFNSSPISPIKENPKENIISNNVTTTKLNTLIKSNENFKEIYDMINNNIPTDNNKLTKNNSNHIYKSNKIEPIFRGVSQTKKDFNFSNASLNELLSKNINDVKQMKFKQKQNSSFMKGKMSMLYGEISKLTKRNYHSKSIGPYLRHNKSNSQVNNNNNFNPTNTNIGVNAKSMQHLMKIKNNPSNNENNSFYFPQKHKKHSSSQYHSNQKTSSQNFNKRNVFTSVDKWIENESNPHSFFKEKENTIKKLLSSVHGFSFTNDYSMLNKTSCSYNNMTSKYNNNFYTNELNAFTMRLHKQCNTTVDKQLYLQSGGNVSKRNFYFNSRNSNRRNHKKENKTSEEVIPFYSFNKNNLYKSNENRLFY